MKRIWPLSSRRYQRLWLSMALDLLKHIYMCMSVAPRCTLARGMHMRACAASFNACTAASPLGIRGTDCTHAKNLVPFADVDAVG